MKLLSNRLQTVASVYNANSGTCGEYDRMNIGAMLSLLEIYERAMVDGVGCNKTSVSAVIINAFAITAVKPGVECFCYSQFLAIACVSRNIKTSLTMDTILFSALLQHQRYSVD